MGKQTQIEHRLKARLLPLFIPGHRLSRCIPSLPEELSDSGCESGPEPTGTNPADQASQSSQASRDERFREHTLLRTLGAIRKLIRGSLAAEFLVLGLFAGIVAVLGAEITSTMLQTQIFNLKMELHPWLWVTGPVLGALIISLVGLSGTRKLVDAPPLAVLRGLD